MLWGHPAPSNKCVAFALLPFLLCAFGPVIQAFVSVLSCFAPHPVLGFPTGLYPVGFEVRIHYKEGLFRVPCLGASLHWKEISFRPCSMPFLVSVCI